MNITIGGTDRGVNIQDGVNAELEVPALAHPHMKAAHVTLEAAQLLDSVEIVFDWSLDAQLWPLPTKLAQLNTTCRCLVEQMWRQTAKVRIRGWQTARLGFHVDMMKALRAFARCWLDSFPARRRYLFQKMQLSYQNIYIII